MAVCGGVTHAPYRKVPTTGLWLKDALKRVLA